MLHPNIGLCQQRNDTEMYFKHAENTRCFKKHPLSFILHCVQEKKDQNVFNISCKTVNLIHRFFNIFASNMGARRIFFSGMGKIKGSGYERLPAGFRVEPEFFCST